MNQKILKQMIWKNYMKIFKIIMKIMYILKIILNTIFMRVQNAKLKHNIKFVKNKMLILTIM